ncbi:MAG: ArsR/SmtB family transcription factor [Candidatus Geothermarchaeales archaeon]
MRAVKMIRDPKAFQLVADDTRRRMIFLLRVKERSVSQIAEELEKTPQVIYHHIKKLRDADMVEVAREERVDHFIETYYQASAEVFEFHYGEEGGREYAKKQVKEALDNLYQLDLNVRADDETVAKVVELKERMDAIGSKGEWMERIESLEDLTFTCKQDVAGFANLLSMTDEQLDEWRTVHEELRDLLKSRLVEPVKERVQAE